MRRTPTYMMMRPAFRSANSARVGQLSVMDEAGRRRRGEPRARNKRGRAAARLRVVQGASCALLSRPFGPPGAGTQATSAVSVPERAHQIRVRAVLLSMPLGRDEETRRLRAYRNAPSDADAARALGLSKIGFVNWRRGRGLPSKAKPGPYVGPAEEQRRLRAYHATRSDSLAAKDLGISRSAFTAWRRSRGLRADGRRLTRAEERERRRVVRASASDAEAAKALGISRQAVTQWRHTRE